ncbi:hypothetical protein MFFC18_16130 [Mariniblastus fucicola]|uniref:Uncharacterized protein n=1 Tax=Mariniblastus fucicola TaxID=980251 RepID=A0A5B9P656_9BACT|nr:hypothetical protein MFFC18_16130 [Mariniblastus fucicola]
MPVLRCRVWSSISRILQAYWLSYQGDLRSTLGYPAVPVLAQAKLHDVMNENGRTCSRSETISSSLGEAQSWALVLVMPKRRQKPQESATRHA